MPGGPGDERPGDEVPEQAVLIQIPDDARELDDEIAAYHRELQSARRRARANRVLLLDRWRRFGVTGPVAIGVLAMAIAVTALFVALRPDRAGSPRPEPLATQPNAAVGSVGGLITDAGLLIGTTRSARSLRPAVLALVPPSCGCFDVVDSLARQAGQFGLKLYVVAPAGVDAQIDEMTSNVHGGRATPAFDPTGALAQTYRASGVTAILLRSDGVVTGVVRDVTTSTRVAGLASLNRLSE